MNRALLVVDMQNGFCHPEGSFTRIGMGLEGAGEAVRNAARAVGQARRAAIPVIFTRHLYRPGRADEGQALKQNSPALAGLHGLQGGTWDAEVVAELGCGPLRPRSARRSCVTSRLPCWPTAARLRPAACTRCRWRCSPPTASPR